LIPKILQVRRFINHKLLLSPTAVFSRSLNMNSNGRHYNLAGLKICLSNTHKVLEAAIDKAFSLSRTVSTDAHVYLEGNIQEDDSFVEAMPSLIRKPYERLASGEDPVILFGPDDELSLLAKGKYSSSYAYSLPPFNHAQLVCQRLTGKATPLLFQSVLIPLVSELLLKQGKLLMHAGCVATPEGDGILLLADGGGGKTTTVYTMVRQGFHFLSDDLVVASCVDDGFVFEPVYEKINLSKKTIKFFPELSFLHKALAKSREKKISVDPEAIIKKDQLAHLARASAILIIKLDQSGPRLLDRDASAFLNPLLKSNTFASRDEISKRSLGNIWRLLEQTVSYQLNTGFDPANLGKWLAQKAAAGNLGPVSQTLAEGDSRQGQKKEDTVAPQKIVVRNPFRRYYLLLQALLGHTLDGKKTDLQLIGRLSSQAGRQRFLTWLKYHRIENHLAKYLTDLNVDRAATYAIDYTSQLRRAKAHFILMQATAKKVARHLMASAIPAVMLRGPALAMGYYPDPYLRHCRDVDVIVKPEHLEDAEKILVSLGFSLNGSRRYWHKKGELPFSNGQVIVELHWNAYPMAVVDSSGSADIWLRPDALELDGFAVKALNPDHLLLSSCLHLTCEHRLDRLIRVIDIRQIVNKTHDTIDWNWIVARAMDSAQGLVVWQALRFASEIVSARVPAIVLQKLAPARMSEKMAANIFPPAAILATPSNNSRLRRFVFFKMLKLSRIGNV
jgi:hypothetical protein